MKKDYQVKHGNAQRPVNIKEHNSKLILNLMQSRKQISATELASITMLSKTTMTKIFSHLNEIGLIKQTGHGESTKNGGKRPLLYSLASDYCYTVIVLANRPELIEVYIADSNENIIAYEKSAVNKNIAYESFLDTIAKMMNDSIEKLDLSEDKIAGAALLYDGIVDSGIGMILDSAFHDWKPELPVVKNLKERLSFDINVVIGNATDFSGYAEVSFYEANNKKKMVISLDNNGSVGCTLMLEELSDVIDIFSGISGGFAHMIIDSTSKIPCKCGLRGCMQSVLSLEALRDAVENRIEKYPNSPVSLKYQGGICNYDTVFENAARGDELAEWLMDKVAYYYSILIHNALMLNSIDIVILQGVFAKSGEKFRNLLYKKIKNFNKLHIPVDLEISYSEFGKSDTETQDLPYVRGASLYFTRKYINDSGVLR